MYPSSSGWPLLLGLLFAGYLIEFTTARVCRGTFNVTRSEDVESLFQDCTRVVGDITITDTYSGPFVLPNIRTIDGTLKLEWITSISGQNNSTAPQVTSVELPDTTTIKNVKITNITALKTISMPELTTVGWQFSVYQHGIVTDTLDLPLLRDVPSFYLAGPFSRVNVDSLRNASQYLDIYGPRVGTGVEDTGNPLEIRFPSLQYARRILVEGKISSISMPELKSVGWEHTSGGYSDDIMIRAKDTPASFSFPSLTNMTGTFSMSGPIRSVDLSSLQSLRVYFTIGTSHALNLTLPVRKADSISLSGAIESVDFPHLEDFNSINIHSSLSVGCKNFSSDMEEISQSLGHKTDYYCSEPQPRPSLLGLIALCAIPVAAIAAGGYFCTKKRHEQDDQMPSVLEKRPLSPIKEGENEKAIGHG